jgi:predicted transposase/invertase (TIGR01784 family)
MTKRNRKTSKDEIVDLGVFMNIKTDYAFKKVFFNKRLLISFLNSLGTLPETIEDLEYMSEAQLGYAETNRKAVYDVYVKTTSRARYIIEMQIADQEHFAERMIFYASHAVVGQGHKGKVKMTNDEGKTIKKDWDYNIAGVYMIAIVDFVMFPEEKAKNIFIEEVELMRKQANLPFSDKYKFTIIELPKFQKKLEKLSTLKEKWIFVFRYLHTFRERPEEMNEDVFEELCDYALIENLAPEEMEKYKQSLEDYGDMITVERKGIKKGLEKGLAIGEKRGIAIGEKRGITIGEKRGIEIGEKRGIAKVVKRFRNQGKSIKEIAELLDFTEEQVYNLLDS